jgi:hypothetical protein
VIQFPLDAPRLPWVPMRPMRRYTIWRPRESRKRDQLRARHRRSSCAVTWRSFLPPWASHDSAFRAITIRSLNLRDME